MLNPTNPELASYLREWAKEMEQDEAGRIWLLEAATRLTMMEEAERLSHHDPCANCGSKIRTSHDAYCATCGRLV